MSVVALTVEGIDVTIVPLSESISRSFGTAVTSLGLASVAITSAAKPSETLVTRS